MKKLFLALALLIVFANGAFAASCDANTDKFTSDQWCISSADTLIPTTSAGQQVIYEQYTSVNTNNTLSADETGKVITDTGGAATTGATAFGSKHILPRAAPGLTYTFIVGAKTGITIDTVDTSDTIVYSISGTVLDAGDSITNSTKQAGDSVTLYSTVANRWSIAPINGTWADNSTN